MNWGGGGGGGGWHKFEGLGNGRLKFPRLGNGRGTRRDSGRVVNFRNPCEKSNEIRLLRNFTVRISLRNFAGVANFSTLAKFPAIFLLSFRSICFRKLAQPAKSNTRKFK